MVDEAGNQLGVMSLFDAMKAARDAGLDVVEISPNAVPPVCKLVDYGKFQYEQSKKAHEAEAAPEKLAYKGSEVPAIDGGA